MKKNKIKDSENLGSSKIIIPAIFTYRLPSPEEWENIATMAVAENSIFSVPLPGSTDISKKDNGGYSHLAGNVSEMTSEKGIAKGCNYSQKIQEFDIKQNFSYDKARNWLGFRCVCVINK